MCKVYKCIDEEICTIQIKDFESHALAIELYLEGNG